MKINNVTIIGIISDLTEKNINNFNFKEFFITNNEEGEGYNYILCKIFRNQYNEKEYNKIKMSGQNILIIGQLKNKPYQYQDKTIYKNHFVNVKQVEILNQNNTNNNMFVSDNEPDNYGYTNDDIPFG